MIPVVWWNRLPGAAARGYWDQAIIEAALAGDLWRPPGLPDVTHHEPSGEDLERFPGGLFVVVVVPGRQNAAYAADLDDWLHLWERSLVIVTGDEEGTFDPAAVAGPGRTVWVGGGDPTRPGVDFAFGSGWPGWYRTAVVAGEHDAAPSDVLFAGQVTHERRRQALDLAARRWPAATVLATDTFADGWGHDEYAARMAAAKVVLSPSGPVSPDTFRTYEALEVGAVPVADNRTPGGGPAWDRHWQRLLGDDVPFPTVDGDWDDTVADAADRVLADWPTSANRVWAWWQARRRDLAWQLRDAIPDVERDDDVGYAGDIVTAVVSTSPTPSDPDLTNLATTIESIHRQLPGCEIIVAADGVRPEQAHRADAYAHFLRAVCHASAWRWRNVLPVVADEWGHQALTVRRALEEVRTPLVLFVEHDTPLTDGPVNWPAIIADVAAGRYDAVRLYHEAEVGAAHQHLLRGHDEQIGADGRRRYLRTAQWSQRPHVARTRWYQRTLARHFGAESRTMIEDCLHGVAHVHDRLYGWSTPWRIAIYDPDDGTGNLLRSTHLDARGDDPKFPMVYAYDGPTPEGAPRPTAERDD